MTTRGVDLSRHNGNVNFSLLKSSGIDYVILRAGYGKSATQKDTMFEAYYTGAKAAGLDVGAYWFSYAQTPEEARQEARVCIQCLGNKKFEFPVYYDLEDDPRSNSYPFRTGKANCTAMVEAFCNELEAAGYWTGLYISRSPLTTHIDSKTAERYALWVAEYSDRCRYSGSYGMWQYTSKGRVNGVQGDVDLDECYIDYPAAIRRYKLNGYGGTQYTVSVGPFTTKKDAEEYMKQVQSQHPNFNVKVVETRG